MTEQNDEQDKKEYSNNDNLEFKAIKIEFYPEDIEKMKGMSLAEENSYKLQLKLQGRYIKKYE